MKKTGYIKRNRTSGSQKYIRTVADTERENGVLKILVLEAALLIEEHYDEICDELWYIYTREDIRKRTPYEIARIFPGESTADF